jgi:hypothetical protein
VRIQFEAEVRHDYEQAASAAASKEDDKTIRKPNGLVSFDIGTSATPLNTIMLVIVLNPKEQEEVYELAVRVSKTQDILLCVPRGSCNYFDCHPSLKVTA